MRTSLVWYTKDLRIDDLPAVAQACEESDRVIAVYIWDDEHLEDEADNRKAFLLESISALDTELRQRGSGLLLHRGETVASLSSLCKDYDARAIYCSESRDPATAQLQAKAHKQLSSQGIDLIIAQGNYLLDLDAIRTQAGGVFKVFTPYKNAALKQLKASKSKKAKLPKLELPPIALPRVKLKNISPQRQQGGLIEADKAWKRFRQQTLSSYATSRNELACDGTSRMSAHLHNGTISVHRLLRELQDDEGEGAESFVTELLWREFNYYIAHHFPDVLHTAFRRELAMIEWPGKQAHLEAWKEGRTGYPIIDAAMRELRQTGWMHNRARMIVASFLVKDLLINWQEGEAHFMEWLTDGDQVQNNAGWQWSASTGVDAQPYFRIFNPITQGRKFDANGEYVRRYVPELAPRMNRTIHDVNVDDRYTKAIVDHATQREQALRLFKRAIERHRA